MPASAAKGQVEGIGILDLSQPVARHVMIPDRRRFELQNPLQVRGIAQSTIIPPKNTCAHHDPPQPSNTPSPASDACKCNDSPPSTTRSWPVIRDAASLHRKA